MFYLLFFVIINSLCSNMFNDDILSMDIIGDLKLAYTNNGGLKNAIDAVPVKALLLSGDKKNKIPVLLLRRGGSYSNDLKLIVPANKQYISNTFLDGIDFSDIDDQEMSLDKYTGLRTHQNIIDKDIFRNKNNKLYFIKMLNNSNYGNDNTVTQINILREFYAYKIYEKIFTSDFYLKTKLAKINYYNYPIKNYTDIPKLKAKHLYKNDTVYEYEGMPKYEYKITYKDYYGFFIEPGKNARKRSSRELFPFRSFEQIKNGCYNSKDKTQAAKCFLGSTKKMGYDFDLSSLMSFFIFNSSFGSTDFDITGNHNADMAIDRNNKLLFCAFDFDQPQYDMSRFKDFLDNPFGYNSDFLLTEYLSVYKVNKKYICDEVREVVASIKNKQIELDKIILQYGERIKALDGYQKVLEENTSLDLVKMKKDFISIIDNWNVNKCYNSVD